MVTLHPKFNLQYYEDALQYLDNQASRYGLTVEVQDTFDRFLEEKLNSNATLDLDDYFIEANEALWEWDI